MTSTKNVSPEDNLHHLDVAEPTGPIVFDLGKQARKRVKRLLRGKGKLMAEVRECLAELLKAQKISAAAEPVIIVVREKGAKGILRWPGH